MRLVHLTASTFFGGPERQMLGLAKALPGSVRTTFASFHEGGRCAAFLDEVKAHGFPAVPVSADFPRVPAAARELTALLRDTGCDVLLCHGYKAHILGRVAARRAGVPAVAVSRGWTGETRKVKFYEWLDRRHLRLMDHVVCVSDGQAVKVRTWCRVPESRLTVIRNSARLAAFEHRDPAARERLLAMFPGDGGGKGFLPPHPVLGRAEHRPPPQGGRSEVFTSPLEGEVAAEQREAAGGGETHGVHARRHDTAVSRVVLAAGRLSPEKGFGVLIDAAAGFLRDNPGTGVAVFGEGALRPDLERRVRQLGLAGRFVLPGFRTDLDSLTTAADVVVLSSFTEGLPNVALEASAAGVPVVATAVGGNPEVVADRETGFLVPPGDPATIAARVGELLRDPDLRAKFGAAGRGRMHAHFTFDAQAAAYLKLIDTLTSTRTAATPQAAASSRRLRRSAAPR